ncbi:MAG TPA: hypothetical protein VK797_18515 [Tepidisphaeraceae bacterium]|jgi:hypothetical protein|nr:hypothetical protein [Tepidisphaeraceae bacterium]
MPVVERLEGRWLLSGGTPAGMAAEAPAPLADTKVEMHSPVSESADGSRAVPRPTIFSQSFVDLSSRIVGQPLNQLLATRRHSARGSTAVLVFNSGSIAAVGSLTITLHVSRSFAFAPDLPAVGSEVIRRISLRPGRARVFDVPFTLPAGTAAGAYHLFAVVSGSHGIVETNLGNNTAGSIAPIAVTDTAIAAGGFRRHHHGFNCPDNSFDTGLDGQDFGLAAGAAVLGGSDLATSAPDPSNTDNPTSQPNNAPGDSGPGDSGGGSSDPTDSTGGSDSRDSDGA